MDAAAKTALEALALEAHLDYIDWLAPHEFGFSQ